MKTEVSGQVICTDVLRGVDPASLQHVLWLGGSPCSGKSSITNILANRYAIKAYHVDDAFQQHSPDFTIECYPMNYKWLHTPWQALWMQSQTTLLEEAIHAYSEHLQFIFADLRKMEGLVIAEGTSLLPDYIKPLTAASRALWMVPTEGFQRKTYPKRDAFVSNILQQCEEPKLALQNWMDRDVAFAGWVQARTHQLNLRCIQVDGQRSIEENAALVAEHFQLELICE